MLGEPCWGEITMIKEPNKLVAARAELQRAAEDFRDPGRLGHLRNAINSLLQLMSGVSPRIEKDIAKTLLLTYRNKVLSEAKVILANVESYEPEYLEHWNKVMEVFRRKQSCGKPLHKTTFTFEKPKKAERCSTPSF